MKLFRVLCVGLSFALAGCISSRAINMPTLVEGASTGTVYVGYIKKPLPSGTREVVVDGRTAFRINAGEYTKFQLATGSHHIHAQCIKNSGFSGLNGQADNTFTLAENESVYFMVQFDTNCKKSSKKDIQLVTEAEQRETLLGYKALNFKQTYAKAKAMPKPAKFTGDLNGNFQRQEPLVGSAEIEQKGDKVFITGHDLLTPTPDQVMSRGPEAFKSGEIKVEATLVGKDINGQWWFTNKPESKKPFSATIGKHVSVKNDFVIYTSGEFAGVLYRVKK